MSIVPDRLLNLSSVNFKPNLHKKEVMNEMFDAQHYLLKQRNSVV